MRKTPIRPIGGQANLQHCLEVLRRCEQTIASHPDDPLLRHLAADLRCQVETTQRLISRRARCYGQAE